MGLKEQLLANGKSLNEFIVRIKVQIMDNSVSLIKKIYTTNGLYIIVGNKLKKIHENLNNRWKWNDRKNCY